MNVYICTKFKGHYPVGTAAVVVAKDAKKAARALNEELIKNHSLPGRVCGSNMIRLDTTTPIVVVLNDGDY